LQVRKAAAAGNRNCMKAFGRIDDMSGLEKKKNQLKLKKFQARESSANLGSSPVGVRWSPGVTVFHRPQQGVDASKDQDFWVEMWENQR
jgi:hypothetical protein